MQAMLLVCLTYFKVMIWANDELAIFEDMQLLL